MFGKKEELGKPDPTAKASEDLKVPEPPEHMKVKPEQKQAKAEPMNKLSEQVTLELIFQGLQEHHAMMLQRLQEIELKMNLIDVLNRESEASKKKSKK